ncbi:MAG: hypothetical protein OTJ98_09585 [Dehalococcoidia bacterium]|nr:hypothetical protein [Dehalococcoidia bacterium]
MTPRLRTFELNAAAGIGNKDERSGQPRGRAGPDRSLYVRAINGGVMGSAGLPRWNDVQQGR